MEPVTRSATLTRISRTPTGTIGRYRSDSGLELPIVELAWKDNAVDISCIPPAPDAPPIRYLCTFRWSNAHKKNLYHIEGVDGRDGCELHSANVADELLGCAAPGMAEADFPADSIKPGIPRVASRGVTRSVEALAKLEADMRDKDSGEQLPFYLTIQ